MNHKQHSMINALRNKRGAGLDVTIILGKPEDETKPTDEMESTDEMKNEEDKTKELGLAPEATEIGGDDLDAKNQGMMDVANDEKENFDLDSLMQGSELSKGSLATKALAKKKLMKK